jgi:FecR-like protein
MKLKQLLIPLFLLFAALPLIPSMQQPAASPSPAPLAGATVADLKGKVQVELPGQTASAPSRGQVLPAETIVTTEKGRMLLRLEDGSEILVNPNTRLVLKQPVPSNWQRLQLLLGKIKAEIQKRVTGAPPFQVGTPSAVISVRGTRFYVEVDKHNMTRVSVEEGEVQLESSRGIGKPVIIKPGFSSRVGEDSAPDPPQASPGAGRPPNSGLGRDNSTGGLGQQRGASSGRGGGRRP